MKKKIVIGDSVANLDKEICQILASNQICIFDDALDKDFCRELIQKFISERKFKKTNIASDYGIVSFNEQNITESTGWKREHNIIFDYVQHYEELYKKSLNIPDYAWPKNHGYEQSRIKQYLPNLYDRFDPHVDVGNYNSARRFLVMFWYLNDVVEGGETEFVLNDYSIKIKPKAGRLLCFPPMWTHPHAGLPPVSCEKYIVGTYLHYI